MTDSRMYPTGSGGAKSRPIKGTLVDFGVLKAQRTRATVAQINAGFTLLPALPGVKWRLVDWDMIAIGGAVTGATDVRILGTQSGSSAALGATAVAALTQSAVVRAGASNAVVLANGASFVACDANTKVTVGKTGGSAATATAVDITLLYVADPA